MRVQEDLVLGKKLASGGFGTVYKAGLIDHNLSNSEARDVILKKVCPTQLKQLYYIAAQWPGWVGDEV